MTREIKTALQPIAEMIGALAPRLRGALVEQLVDELARERPDSGSRKARVLDTLVAEALPDTPLPTRVRASPKLARCVSALPEATMALACDVVTVAEIILTAPDLTDDLLIRVCAPERQDHMKIIAGRTVVSPPLADSIVEHGESATVLVLVKNAGAQVTPRAFGRLAELSAGDAAIRSALVQRADCPPDIAGRLVPAGSGALPEGDDLIAALQGLAGNSDMVPAMDLLMRCIGRDRDAGRKILERDDEKTFGAVCHFAGVDADTYEALIGAWRVSAGKSTADVHKAPVRFRLMRPAEIDRAIARLPLARMRMTEVAVG